MVTLVHPEDPEWKMFKARCKLNGRCVIGKGKSPKQAEQAAARKYLNNNFMPGENSPQAEIERRKTFHLNQNQSENRRKEWRNSMQRRKQKVKQKV